MELLRLLDFPQMYLLLKEAASCVVIKNITKMNITLILLETKGTTILVSLKMTPSLRILTSLRSG